MNMTQQRVSVTVQQAAEITGLSADVIRRAYRSGILPVHYVTARPVILVSDLEAWIAAAPMEPTP